MPTRMPSRRENLALRTGKQHHTARQAPDQSGLSDVKHHMYLRSAMHASNATEGASA